jgi:carboxyl-terminal processing protease
MMSNTILRRFVYSVLVAVTFLTLVSTSVAQIRIPSSAVVSETKLSEIREAGFALEQQRRWGEALVHWEQAVRQYPDAADLQQRLTFAKIHYDLGRRYSDSSFVASLHQLTSQKTLDLYSEVLLKIQSHYVESPNWKELVGRGTLNLDVALADPEFVARHMSDTPPDKIAACIRHIHSQLDSRPVPNRHDANNVVAWISRYVSRYTGLSPQATLQEYVAGATGALDDYSSYLTANQLDDVFSQIEGNFVGLGVELKADGQSLLIVDVIPGGPAAEGGVRGGDRIVEVDGQTMQDVSTDQAADMLKGEEGSAVSLKVLHSDGSWDEMRLVRKRVDVPSVIDVKIVESRSGIAYLRITTFQKTTSRDVDEALWDLHRKGMRSLIVDVRGNPGGLLTASVEVADKFVSNGSIVSTRGRSSRENFDYSAHSVGTWRVPLVVLIDGDSASASEIFAGAIRDHRRGAVVGQRSFGKGSVQGIFPLSTSKAGVRLTTAKFYSPNGHAISKQGVSPDVVVHLTARVSEESAELPNDGDVVLNAGIEVARDRLSQR